MVLLSDQRMPQTKMDVPLLQTFSHATLYDMILLIAFTEFHGQTNRLWPKQLTYINATNAHIND